MPGRVACIKAEPLRKRFCWPAWRALDLSGRPRFDANKIEATSYPFENQPFTNFNITVYRLSANIAKATSDPQTLRYGDKRQATAVDSNEWIFKGHAGDIVSLALTPDVIGAGALARLSGPQDILLYQGNSIMMFSHPLYIRYVVVNI